MKKTLLPLLALVFAAPFALQAQSAYLLKGDSIVAQDGSFVATGRAEIMAKDASVRFTAERISYDQASHTAKLSGGVMIHAAGGAAIPATELTLDVKDARVFTLSKGNVTLATPSGSTIADANAAVEFAREFPMSELVLRRSAPYN